MIPTFFIMKKYKVTLKQSVYACSLDDNIDEFLQDLAMIMRKHGVNDIYDNWCRKNLPHIRLDRYKDELEIKNMIIR